MVVSPPQSNLSYLSKDKPSNLLVLKGPKVPFCNLQATFSFFLCYAYASLALETKGKRKNNFFFFSLPVVGPLHLPSIKILYIYYIELVSQQHHCITHYCPEGFCAVKGENENSFFHCLESNTFGDSI